MKKSKQVDLGKRERKYNKNMLRKDRRRFLDMNQEEIMAAYKEMKTLSLQEEIKQDTVCTICKKQVCIEFSSCDPRKSICYAGDPG